MRGVVLRDQRRTVTPVHLTRDNDREAWVFLLPHAGYQVEVFLEGGDAGPGPVCLALAERVTSQIDEFVAVARDYLRAFVDCQRLGCAGEWNLEWLEFGPHSDELSDPFEMVFGLEGDGYGGWGVRFSDSRGSFGFCPYEFRRFQR